MLSTTNIAQFIFATEKAPCDRGCIPTPYTVFKNKYSKHLMNQMKISKSSLSAHPFPNIPIKTFSTNYQSFQSVKDKNSPAFTIISSKHSTMFFP